MLLRQFRLRRVTRPWCLALYVLLCVISLGLGALAVAVGNRVGYAVVDDAVFPGLAAFFNLFVLGSVACVSILAVGICLVVTRPKSLGDAAINSSERPPRVRQ